MKKIIPKHAALIPDNAKQVFNGDIFKVYQWPQEMFDGTTKTFEMLKRTDTTQVLAIRDGKIILIEDEQPGRPIQIHVPGGRVDPEDTSWLSAAKRELKEETGLEFNNWRLISAEQPIIKIEWFCPVYLATDLSHEGPQNADTAGERIKLMPTTFEEVKSRVLSGQHPAISYLVPIFSRLNSLDELLALPEFAGQEVDR